MAVFPACLQADFDLEKFLLDAAGKHKALQKSKRPRSANNPEKKPFPLAIDTLERDKRLILAAIRVWELKQGLRV